MLIHGRGVPVIGCWLGMVAFTCITGDAPFAIAFGAGFTFAAVFIPPEQQK